MVKVSIIIPIYNVEDYLRECLDSVTKQTLRDIEIICINDGSTDNSLTILEEYAQNDNRITIVNRENKGMANARNTGIKIATGEYIAFVDSDDYIDIDYYEKLYNAAVEEDCDIAVSGITRFCENKSNNILSFYKKSCAITAWKKYKLCKIPKFNYVWNKIYKRKSILNSNILFEENTLWEDIDFSHKVIFYLNKVVTVPKINYYYRNRSDSIVNTVTEQRSYWISSKHKKGLAFAQANNIKLSQKQLNEYHWTKLDRFKILGITVLTIKTYGTLAQYYLFNIIKVFERYTCNWKDSSVFNIDKDIIKCQERS